MLLVPPSTGLYFSLNGVIYNPGSSINIADIGEQPEDRNLAGSTLVCVTTNVNTQCCRGSDNPNGGSIGGWLDPNNTPIPAPGALGGATNVFTHYLFTEQVRLVILGGTPSGPLGVYTCTVPDFNGVDVYATITITKRTGIVRPLNHAVNHLLLNHKLCLPFNLIIIIVLMVEFIDNLIYIFIYS